MKKIFQLVVIFIFFSVYSQQKTDENYKKFQKIKYDTNSYMLYDGILSNEYNVYYTKTDSSFINTYKFVTFGILRDYYYESPLKLTFWVVPIKVYIEKKINENVKKEFTTFIKNLPKIRNLQIEIVSSKEQANYIIKTNESRLYTKIEGYNKFQNPEYFYGINFEMIKDGNGNIYSGSLFINPKQIINSEIQTKKIKQFFLSSLGSFIISNFLGKDSLFSEEYINTEKISEIDIKILQKHYDYYNLNKITNLDFDKIQQELKKIVEPANNTNLKIKIQ